MSLIRLENVTKSFAGEPVLDEVSLRIEERERIGLIGRNGTGKSTIFRIITGEMEPDSGVIERMRRMRFACLAQLPQVPEDTPIEAIVMDSFSELIEQEKTLSRLEHQMGDGDESVLAEYSDLQHEFSIRGGYTFRTRVRQVLQGLGFRLDEFALPYSSLSGGQRTRLRLALVLLQDADLLLLDEPENHLDMEAREWLEAYIRNCREAVMIISHDRRMLNSVTERIIEVERGEVFDYTGNYDYYVGKKALLREQQQKAFEKQEDFIRKENALIDRFRYKSTKARMVQSRLKRLDSLEKVDAPPPEASEASFGLGEVSRSGEVVLDARGLAMAYGPLRLYNNVSFTVRRGERVGIIGPNGTGKTTLLRHIAGQHGGTAGEATLGHKVSIAFFEQNHDNVNRANDILGEIMSMKPDWKPEQGRRFLARFLFTGDDVFKPVSTLSGGELARVAMGKLILSGANLLLLDEPTNHLDIASREALEMALAAYEGSVILASHDRTLVDKLVDKLVIFENGTATVHLGNYTHYRWKHKQEEEDREIKSTDEVLRIRRETEEREKKKTKQRDERKDKKRIEKLESDIAAMEGLIEEFSHRFAALDPTDYAKAQELKDEYDGMKQDLQELYAEWEELAG
jgi:ATP-binding cassette subfamily F protein 3